jgi:serralysin
MPGRLEMPTIISTNTTWTAGQTIYLNDEVQIAPGATLTIDPGAIISGGKITAFGKLDAKGTAQSPILFENVNINYGGEYNGVHGRLEIDYAQIYGGTFLPPTGNAIYGNFSLTNSVVSNMGYYTYIWYPDGESVLSNNIFLGVKISSGIDARYSGNSLDISDNVFYQSTLENWANYGNNGIIVESNSFLSSKLDLLYDSGSMDALNSYFGTTDYAKIQEMIHDRSDDLKLKDYIESNGYQANAPSTNPTSLFSYHTLELPTEVVVDGKLFGINNINLTGNTLNNSLIGNSGNNLLSGLSGNDLIDGREGNDFIDGGVGADTMIGGTGNDTFLIDNTGDIVVELAGYAGGFDTIISSVSYTLSRDAAVEDIRTDDPSGLSEIRLSGNNFSQTITGNAGANILEGDGGNDVLNGMGGNDSLSGGKGSDVIDGGDGVDTVTLKGLNGAYQQILSHNGTVYALDGIDRSHDAITNIEAFTDGGQTIGLSQIANFDALKYVASYNDLAQAIRTDANGAAQHYLNYGFNEGRQAGDFDAAQYLDNYDDLKFAFGTNLAAATNHFISNGVDEHRLADSPLDYVASYSDLVLAFGDGNEAQIKASALEHYAVAGFTEGRRAEIDFDVNQYLENYSDLASAFTDKNDATVHYIKYGFNEHRLSDDPLEYIASNIDLMAAFRGQSETGLEQSGLSHFASNGFSEGRTMDGFDVGKYLSNYDDLKIAFADGNGGYDENAALLHYINYGSTEGRSDDLMFA